MISHSWSHVYLTSPQATTGGVPPQPPMKHYSSTPSIAPPTPTPPPLPSRSSAVSLGAALLLCPVSRMACDASSGRVCSLDPHHPHSPLLLCLQAAGRRLGDSRGRGTRRAHSGQHFRTQRQLSSSSSSTQRSRPGVTPQRTPTSRPSIARRRHPWCSRTRRRRKPRRLRRRSGRRRRYNMSRQRSRCSLRSGLPRRRRRLRSRPPRHTRSPCPPRRRRPRRRTYRRRRPRRAPAAASLL